MNKFKFYFIVLCSAVTLFSCNKSDDNNSAPPRDFAVQDADDTVAIEHFLNHHYLNPANDPDADVTMPLITDPATQPSIKSYLNSATYPKLLVKDVSFHDITYHVYYLKLRDDYVAGNTPSKVDKVLASYNGSYIEYTKEIVSGVTVESSKNTQFEYIPYPDSYIRLDASIKGWSEIFPLFKSGITNEAEGPNPVTYSDFGAGVIFIPSGLGYYNYPPSNSTIPAYSPLIFTFKLYDVVGADQDGDGILSIDEDLNHDGDFTVSSDITVADDDTDGDGIMNYLDVDDDGDGTFTKNEIVKNTDGTITFPDTDGDGFPNYLDRWNLDATKH